MSVQKWFHIFNLKLPLNTYFLRRIFIKYQFLKLIDIYFFEIKIKKLFSQFNNFSMTVENFYINYKKPLFSQTF